MMIPVFRGARTATPRRDQRGQAISLYVLGVISALFVMAGLVVDGGQKAHAISRAESVAAGAARAAANAGAGSTVAPGSSGGLQVGAARQAAQDFLSASTGGGRAAVTGTVTVTDSRVVVNTATSAPTLFLSLIGIDRVEGTGTATAQVVANQ